MSEVKKQYKICSRGVWDTTIPGIKFDEIGVSNYAVMFDKLCEEYPRGEKGKIDWASIVDKIKENGIKKRYDCIIGVSGGTDSSYLLHLAKNEYGLRPLAVNLDNGWSSDIAVQNIKKMTSALDIDLETYVIDYEEVKDLLRCYMFASLPWIDIPTDLAIKAVLFKVANREGIKFILRANDFRSEGTQPREWSYGDGKQLNYLHNKFGKVRLKTFPNYTLLHLFKYALIQKIKNYFPFYYLDYDKQSAQEFLKDNYGWEYYGGHHHENVFTKFAIGIWLPKKFNIDKRKITFSAQILSGAVKREDALLELNKPAIEPELVEREIDYVLKKLDLNHKEYDRIMLEKNKYYYNYPSYYALLTKFSYLAKPILKKFYPYKPMSLFQIEMREK